GFDLEGWRRDTEAFVRAAEPVLAPGPSDVVLDLGCGPGFALAALAPRVREVVGADVAPRLLDLARARLAGRANVTLVALDPAAPGDLGPVGPPRFTVVVVHSVLQYLPDLDAVDALLRAVRGVVVPGARVLVSDVPRGGGRLADAWGLLRGAARQGRLYEAVGRLARLGRSSYAAARARMGLLVPDAARVRRTVEALGGALEEVAAPLSILANRRHWLVRF
ncbi:MAG: methyltransferase domain-containing protein, partial [Planctomycetia bacterium]|nr:methyltransferase domain-containing protein [Planctomycetia bacterium]